MKEISLYIICLLLISVVSGEDLTCKAGYGIGIFTSGLASQCSGLSKVTTEAETSKQKKKTERRIKTINEQL